MEDEALIEKTLIEKALKHQRLKYIRRIVKDQQKIKELESIIDGNNEVIAKLEQDYKTTVEEYQELERKFNRS